MYFGRYFATSSSSFSFLSSTSIMMATEVIGLVIDAMLKIVSFVIGFLRERAAHAKGLVVEDAVLVDDGGDDSRHLTAVGRALEEGRKGGRLLLRRATARRR